MTDLQTKLTEVTTEPGCYLMRDAAGTVIYVGKARNLKKRLTSYFKDAGPADIKTAVLVKKIHAFETIITRSEKEALILESTLIKKHRPRYNVVLKDDKRYPSLRLDQTDDYPHLVVVRKINNDGALYFGPFASAQAVRQTLKIINKTFKLRKCSDREFKTRSRPCLHYQMDACLAPCCLGVDQGQYGRIVREVVLFLKGRTPDLIRQLKAHMDSAAQQQQYERAADLRDKIYALERTLEKQVAVTTDFKDRDVIALARDAQMSVIVIFNVRGGFLLGTQKHQFDATLSTDSEIMESFLRQYYEKAVFIPKEVLISQCLPDSALLQDWLTAVKGQNVGLRQPQRGEKTRLVHMARRNAANELENAKKARSAHMDLLARLQKKLGLAHPPRRIECFDNSNLGGTEAVAAMVVFQDGRPKKSSYRKYIIKTVDKPDDYAYMAEVLKRRYGQPSDANPLPDLLMVDGGRGQLSIALDIVRRMDLVGKVAIAAIAKKRCRPRGNRRQNLRSGPHQSPEYG